MVEQRMIYPLDIKNRLVAKNKDMSIVSNTNGVLFNLCCIRDECYENDSMD